MNASVPHPDFENSVRQFESNWLRGHVPDMKSIMGSSSDRELVIELIAIDMEFRWRGTSGAIKDWLGNQPRIDDYCTFANFPQNENPPVELILEEYRARTHFGDRPTHDHYLTRFPKYVSFLVAELPKIDQQIQIELATSPIANVIDFDLRAPLRYTDYTLLEHLGTGGMGKVYRARQESLKRDVAIKALIKSRYHDPLLCERFLREAQLLGRLRHPNIVGIHGVGQFPNGGFFLVLDFISGGTLGNFPWDRSCSTAERLTLFRTITSAIQYAHGQGVIHCDLKPSNILIDNNVTPFVTDFGLANLVSSSEEELETIHGGTRVYAAPEQIQGKSLTQRTDIYGLGMLLLELLAGRPPRELSRKQRVDFLSHHLEIGGLGSGISWQLKSVFTRCLQEDPSDRFQSMEELCEALP